MEEQKEIIRELIARSSYEIESYREINFREKNRSFEGTPRRHHFDNSKLVLLIDPFSNEERFLEFATKSISYIEEIGTITSGDGRSALKVRIWVKAGSVGIESRPFIVS